MSTEQDHYQALLNNFADFTRKGGGMSMRSYQLEPARAILHSIRHNLGLDIVVIMPRQSGKDELLAQLKTYLMRRLSDRERSIVEVNPTYKPQTIGAIYKLENRLDSNLLTRLRWRKRSDFLRMIGGCRTAFFSGDGHANVVGATADLLLIINEAQDIQPAIYEKHFAPMAASRMATRLFCGTVWTSTTLLAQMQRTCLERERADGIRRVFLYSAEEVRKENPSYGRFVDEQVGRLGRQHPLVKTQFFCEEIDAEAGMFGPGRLALMQGDRPAQEQPRPGAVYAFLLDVAGQDEANMTIFEEGDKGEGDMGELSANRREFSRIKNGGLEAGAWGEGKGESGRDAAALSIVEIDLSSLGMLQGPTYRVVKRLQWTGANHLTLFGALKSLGEAWQPQHIVIDATGVGEGLWAMLDRAFPRRVQPVKFTRQEKSEIGWRFLSIIETGRFRDCCSTEQVRAQYAACRSEILPGPAHTLRWGAPEGGPIHDDIVLADSLVASLDQLKWRPFHQPGGIIYAPDPLDPRSGWHM